MQLRSNIKVKLAAGGSCLAARPPSAAFARSCRCSVRIRASSPASEQLQALLCDVAALSQSTTTDRGRSAKLQDPDMVHTMQQLASGSAQLSTKPSCDPQGLTALEQLLAGHLSPQQQQALSAAAAAAAAAPPQLQPQQELELLLKEPLVKTALRRMGSDPQLGLSAYGSNPSVNRSLQLLDQVLSEESATRQVVECMLAGAAAHRAEKQQHQQQRQQQRQLQVQHDKQLQQPQHEAAVSHFPAATHAHAEQQHTHASPRHKQHARTAVIARSANSGKSTASSSAHVSASNGSSSA